MICSSSVHHLNGPLLCTLSASCHPMLPSQAWVTICGTTSARQCLRRISSSVRWCGPSCIALPSKPSGQLCRHHQVPTLDGRSVLATGNCLAVLLGYDKSGLGEVVLPELGMPLRDTDPHQPVRTRGDIIIKFAVQPSTRPRRVAVGGEGICTPPITLLTTMRGEGAEGELGIGLNGPALESALLHSWMPALLRLLHGRCVMEGRNSQVDASKSVPASPDVPSERKCLPSPQVHKSAAAEAQARHAYRGSTRVYWRCTRCSTNASQPMPTYE